MVLGRFCWATVNYHHSNGHESWDVSGNMTSRVMSRIVTNIEVLLGPACAYIATATALVGGVAGI